MDPKVGECRRGDSNPHGSPHTPLKRTCLPIPPLRQREIELSNYFLAGAGVADATGEAAGLELVTGEAAGLALVEGAVAGVATGAGVALAPAPLLATVLTPNPGIEKSRAMTIKMPARIAVAFSSGFCGPRGPNADWLPAPPKADATSPPLPDCNKIASTNRMAEMTKMVLKI